MPGKRGKRPVVPGRSLLSAASLIALATASAAAGLRLDDKLAERLSAADPVLLGLLSIAGPRRVWEALSTSGEPVTCLLSCSLSGEWREAEALSGLDPSLRVPDPSSPRFADCAGGSTASASTSDELAAVG